jgi:hypothetical protein
MTIRAVAKAFLLLTLIPALSRAQSPKETDWQPPLAEGGAPECPDHIGSRTLRSEMVFHGTVKIYIEGTAERGQNKVCHSKASLIITGRTPRTLSLPGAADHGFSIVDFSPDGQSVLLESDGGDLSPNWDVRYVSIAVIGLAKGNVDPVNAWDVFGWGDCYATVEPQGFTNDGKILLLARPTVVYSHRNDTNCVSDWGLYATDLSGPPVRLPDDTKIPRFAKAVAEQLQACKTDPDIVDACFTVHGRLSAWNGSPTMRIWRAGTKRILGDHDDWPLPEKLAEHMGWDVEAWGDFEVCPFTKERPGAMQMVCIESVSHVVYKKR